MAMVSGASAHSRKIADMDNSEAGPPLLDDERLREVLDLLSEDESGAFAGWIARLDADLVKFRTLMASNDTIASLAEIAGSSHSLKGTCLVMGASALAGLFAALETHAKAGNRADADRLYATTRDLELATLQALREASATS
jgi:HPt (histidine-containing phosphotransfer) domain-containing protein